MARIPDEEIEGLNAEVAVERWSKHAGSCCAVMAGT